MNPLKITCIVGTLCQLTAAEYPSVSVTSSVLNEYVLRPGIPFYDKPVSQNEATVSWKIVYVGVWSSTGLEKSQKTPYSQEYHLYGGVKKTIGWVAFDSNIRYDIFKELSLSRDDFFMFDTRMELVKVPLVQPYIATRYFHGIGSATPDDGWLASFGLRRVQDIGIGIVKNNYAKFIFDTSFAYSDGALSRDAEWVYCRIYGGLNVPITPKLSLMPHTTVQVPFDSHGKGSKPYTDGTTHVIYGLSLNYRF